MTVLDVMHMEHTEAWEKEDPLLGTPSFCFISYKKWHHNPSHRKVVDYLCFGWMMLIFSFKCCTNLPFPCSFFVWKVQIHDCGHCQSLIVHKLLLHTSSCWLSDGPHPAGQKLWNFAQASHPILGTNRIISAWETQEFSMQWCKKYRTDLFPFSSLSLNVWLSHASIILEKASVSCHSVSHQSIQKVRHFDSSISSQWLA